MDIYETDIQATYPNKFVCADCFDDDHLKSPISVLTRRANVTELSTVERTRPLTIGAASAKSRVAALSH
jgi:hypothetical protein